MSEANLFFSQNPHDERTSNPTHFFFPQIFFAFVFKVIKRRTSALIDGNEKPEIFLNFNDLFTLFRVTVHYAESETFATLKKRQLWNFFSPI